MHSLMPVAFSRVVIYEWPFTRIVFCLFCFAVVVIKCFMIGVNVWWVYLAPQNISRAISVLTLGNKVVLYCINFLLVSVRTCSEFQLSVLAVWCCCNLKNIVKIWRKTPNTGLQQPSSNHCHNCLRHRSPKLSANGQSFIGAHIAVTT